MSSPSASPSHSGSASITMPANFKIVGIVLAIVSGFLIGSSFVFKKKGLLASSVDGKLGEGVAYLKSGLWWTGMSMMIVGEICNFAAYSFVEAIVVTPLGALSVVICAILSHFFLNESLTTFGVIGCALCIVGSVVIALNGPKEETVGQIVEFQALFLAPGFLIWGGLSITASIVIIVFFAPKYGEKSMLWYIAVCSLIGGLSVSCTTGLGAAIVTSIMGDNQFKHWFIYFLLGFVTITLVTEIFYLNKALALFNTALVTPTYYVLFTSATLISSIVLFQGLKAPAASIITLVMGFLTICLGITLLQMSKVDPTTLTKLDRRSTILLQAARRPTELQEKSVAGYEDPSMDALRGGFGTVGSIIRARSMRKLSMHGPPSATDWRQRHPYASEVSDIESTRNSDYMAGVQRHQLYDAPVPRHLQDDATSVTSGGSGLKQQQHKSIKFGTEDLRHLYPAPGGPGQARTDSILLTETAHQTPPPRGASSLAGTAIRALPPPPNPFAEKSKAGATTYVADPVDSSSEEDLSREAQPLTAHRYPHGVPEDDREEREGLVGHSADSSVRLVQPRRV